MRPYRGPVSARDVVVLAAASVIVLLTAMSAAGRARPGLQRWTTQMAVGLVCGVVGAVAVAAPFVDVVPDAQESPRAALILLVAGVVAAGIALGGRARRSRDQVPRS